MFLLSSVGLSVPHRVMPTTTPGILLLLIPCFFMYSTLCTIHACILLWDLTSLNRIRIGVGGSSRFEFEIMIFLLIPDEYHSVLSHKKGCHYRDV